MTCKNFYPQIRSDARQYRLGSISLTSVSRTKEKWQFSKKVTSFITQVNWSFVVHVKEKLSVRIMHCNLLNYCLRDLKRKLQVYRSCQTLWLNRFRQQELIARWRGKQLERFHEFSDSIWEMVLQLCPLSSKESTCATNNSDVELKVHV